MGDRLLSGAILVLLLVLGLAVITSERSVSRFMESCGSAISDVFGL